MACRSYWILPGICLVCLHDFLLSVLMCMCTQLHLPAYHESMDSSDSVDSMDSMGCMDSMACVDFMGFMEFLKSMESLGANSTCPL